ncbi:MAG TPA: type I-D CRISPR-associated endonuclease Cas1d [Ktedonobacterales bacterium]|jgi:CRISPR-associated protein Cas1
MIDPRTESEPRAAAVLYTTGVEELMGALYLTEPYSLVQQEGEALVVNIPANKALAREQRKVRVPLIRIDQVIVFGEITLTASALQMLLERRIAVHYLTSHGRSYGSVVPDPTRNAALRLGQFRAYHEYQTRFHLASGFVAGKLRNMRTVLLRYERKREEGAAGAAARQIKTALHDLLRLQPSEHPEQDKRMHGLGQILGCEGQGTNAYFAALGTVLQDPWRFIGRNRRPPRDPVNALLSLGYTILANQTVSLITLVGLDPYIGYLHSPGFGKPALALDVIEEFRPLVVDPVVVTMLNTNALHERDFVDEFGSVRLTDRARKAFLEKLEERLNTTIQHPYFGYKTTYRRCIELQVRLLGKVLLGELPNYQPFIVR